MAANNRFLALLRGINVGGNNIIPMKDLTVCFEEMGFRSVQTYIQSGNIVFESRKRNISRLTKEIEDGLSARFDYAAKAVVLSRDQYAAMLDQRHANWGKTEGWRHDALFLFPEIAAEEIESSLPRQQEKIEKITFVPGAVFCSTSRKHMGRAILSKLAKLPAYKKMTIRNHNTTFKLLEMLQS